MRGRILEILRAGGQEPVSGEELSRQLDVSRTAVWKHIQALKAEGYDIESVPKKRLCFKICSGQAETGRNYNSFKNEMAWAQHSLLRKRGFYQ